MPTLNKREWVGMEIAGHTSLVMDGGWWGMGEGLLMAEGKAGEERWNPGWVQLHNWGFSWWGTNYKRGVAAVSDEIDGVRERNPC